MGNQRILPGCIIKLCDFGTAVQLSPQMSLGDPQLGRQRRGEVKGTMKLSCDETCTQKNAVGVIGSF